MFAAPPETALLGVEGAASDANTIYLTLHDGTPSLARSADGGAHWDTVALAPVVGDAFVRIIAVDPTDPRKLFLRASGSAGDRVVVSADGGTTFATPLAVNGGLSAFLRRDDGTILLAGTAADGSSFGARSFDGGATFQPWTGIPHIRALAERNRLVYVAADDAADGFALGVSADDGATFRPLLAYRDVTRIRSCVAAACLETCRAKAEMGLWPAAVCASSTNGHSTDAGGDASSESAAPAGCSLSPRMRRSSPDSVIMLALIGLATLARATSAARRLAASVSSPAAPTASIARAKRQPQRKARHDQRAHEMR